MSNNSCSSSSVISSSILSNGLNVSERIATKNALQRLELNEYLSNVMFWGRVHGMNGDYLIAKSTKLSDCVEKCFYCSYDGGITFAKLPQVDVWIVERCEGIKSHFTGYPSYVYAEPKETKKGDDEEDDDDDEDDEDKSETSETDDDDDAGEAKPKETKRKLTELDRLAWAVQKIDDDTCVVPHGAYLRTPTQQIVTNRDAVGLSLQEACQLSSYLLLRDRISRNTAVRVRKVGVSTTTDFLDTLDDEQSHTWSIRADDSGSRVTLRSLKWLGYELVYDCTTHQFISAYYGNGEQNHDILFMI